MRHPAETFRSISLSGSISGTYLLAVSQPQDALTPEVALVLTFRLVNSLAACRKSPDPADAVVLVSRQGNSSPAVQALDLRLTGKGSIGSITSQGSTFQMIVICKDFFMNGTARSWRAAGSPSGVATLLAGRRVKVTGSYQGMKSFTLAEFTSEMTQGLKLARTIASASLDGRDVVLITYSDGSKLTYHGPGGLTRCGTSRPEPTADKLTSPNSAPRSTSFRQRTRSTWPTLVSWVLPGYCLGRA